MSQRVYITGMGICCPIGNSLEEVADALEQERSGIREISSFDCSPLTMRHAGEVRDIPIDASIPEDHYRIWDRGTRMALHAAGEALRDASIDVGGIVPERFGVCIGTSGSGQYQNARFNLDRSFPLDAELAFYLSRNSPHFQSSQIAAHFGIRGPNLAIGAATAGSGIAIATALSWIRTSRADLVLVGGSESFSLLNVLGFDQLGLSIPHPSTPFSGQPGMTFGEGAGFVILESEASVESRQARVRAELRGVAIRADGFDPVLFDPSGDGQRRAMHYAMQNANCSSDEIDWIRASGTGGRDQDLAETLAIKSSFPSPPPVSSLEPYLGHANGAGPAIGLVAATLCIERGMIPPTMGCTAPRVGCDLDYVTDGVRHQPIQNVLCNTAAFGGINSAIVVSGKRNAASDGHKAMPVVRGSSERSSDLDEIVITGIGMVSAAGCGMNELAESFESATYCFSRDPRLMGDALQDMEMGLVKDFSPRKHCPLVKLRGLEPLTQYAAGAVALALKDADLEKPKFQPERVGVVTGITRSSGVVFERLFAELQQNGFRPSVGRLMLRNGRFMIASQLADWFSFKGYTSTISMGVGCGLHSLAAAYDQLRQDPSLDAIVVVACDELSPFTLRLMRRSGLLAGHHDQWQMYDSQRSGYVPGEGAVAVVLERRSFAEQRGHTALASIGGVGITFDGLKGEASPHTAKRPGWESVDPVGDRLARCYAIACEQSQIDRQEIDLVMGNGTGIWDWDQKELNALTTFFGPLPEFACVNGHIGLCESASALFNLAAAVSSFRSPAVLVSPKSLVNNLNYAKQDESRMLDPIQKNRSLALVTASTEQGHNAAVVLKRSVGTGR